MKALKHYIPKLSLSDVFFFKKRLFLKCKIFQISNEMNIKRYEYCDKCLIV